MKFPQFELFVLSEYRQLNQSISTQEDSMKIWDNPNLDTKPSNSRTTRIHLSSFNIRKEGLVHSVYRAHNTIKQPRAQSIEIYLFICTCWSTNTGRIGLHLIEELKTCHNSSVIIMPLWFSEGDWVASDSIKHLSNHLLNLVENVTIQLSPPHNLCSNVVKPSTPSWFTQFCFPRILSFSCLRTSE